MFSEKSYSKKKRDLIICNTNNHQNIGQKLTHTFSKFILKPLL